MADFLEAAMMACFGLSWPINLVKNLRAGTARSTSLTFYCLILTGYIMGIAAKLILGKYNYVLAVYLVNFVFVAANIAVYFLNRGKDRRREKTAEN